MSTKPLVSLKAMAEGKEEGVQKATYFKVDPDLVVIEEGVNFRIPGPELDAHLEQMYVAMKAGASFPPIDVIVEDGVIKVRRGFCRTTTAKRLKAEGIPITLEARQYRGSDVDTVFDMLGENMGKPFTPLEQGRGFFKLVRYGLSIPEIAERTGFHRSTIDNGLALAESPMELQRMISTGQVSSQVALEAIKAHGAKALDYLNNVVAKAQERGVTKVTKKHVSGPRVTKKIALSFVSAAGVIRKAVDNATLNEACDLGDDAKVLVPAKALKELLDAYSKTGAEDDEL